MQARSPTSTDALNLLRYKLLLIQTNQTVAVIWNVSENSHELDTNNKD